MTSRRRIVPFTSDVSSLALPEVPMGWLLIYFEADVSSTGMAAKWEPETRLLHDGLRDSGSRSAAGVQGF